MEIKQQFFQDLETMLERLEIEDVKSMEIMFTVRQKVNDIELYAREQIKEQFIKNPPHSVRESVLKLLKT